MLDQPSLKSDVLIAHDQPDIRQRDTGLDGVRTANCLL